MKKNIVIIEESVFYPNAGGQECDTGEMTISGTTYKVLNVEQVGKSVLHFLD